MANTVRRQTIKVRSATVRDLRVIYRDGWSELEREADSYIDGIYFDDEDASKEDRLKYAKKNGKGKLIAIAVLAIILANRKAIDKINEGIDSIYRTNVQDIQRQIKKNENVTMSVIISNLSKLLSTHTKKAYNEKLNKANMSRKVARLLDTMIGAGFKPDEMAKGLEKMYFINQSSAIRIITTETTRMSAKGRYDAMLIAEKYGFEFQKVWRHAVFVENPRDWHVKLDGVTVPLHEPFLTAMGNELMYPGDPSAPAEETINCHCYLDEIQL